MIIIADYGMGNLGSVLNMFKRIGVEAQISSDLEVISRASKILLPGVGAFDTAMSRICEMGLKEILNKKALFEKVPILGICLGMQLLTNRSEEGKLPGLGWIDGEALSFKQRISLKVPHMGWNIAKATKQSCLTKGLEDDARFYFVHSYYVNAPNHSIMQTNYEIDFESAIAKDNIFGAQFHPEKSHKYGMQLLKNFADI